MLRSEEVESFQTWSEQSYIHTLLVW